MNKIIFISVFQSFVSRNILNTGVLDEFLEHGSKVILFVPFAKASFYRSTYAHENVRIEAVDIENFNTYRELFFRSIALLLISTNAMKYRKIKILQKEKKYAKYAYQRAITAFFGHSNFIKNLYRRIEDKYNQTDAYEHYFEIYNPDIVFAPDVFGAGDVMMLKSAKRRGIKSVAMVASWDNNTTKGLMRVMPDNLLVQNLVIKEESVNIQNVPEEIIKVVGIAHYDYYKNYQPVSRLSFFKRLGLSPEKKIVVFSPAGDKFISTDWQICEILKQAFAEGKLPEDLVILVRMHPTNPASLKSFIPDEHFIIEAPGISFEGADDKRKELDKESLHHLIDTLHYSEIIINVLSSLVLDAAIMDKPVITIGFEGWEKKIPFGSSVKRYHSDENMAKLLSIGGAPVVKNPEELIEKINHYLESPESDKEGRARIVEEQCYKLDGQAKVRIAEAVLGEYK